jgi:hypothetical protein
MTTYAINGPSATAYQTQNRVLANAVGTQAEIFDTETDTATATTTSLSSFSSGESFVQSVVQSLQNLGLDANLNGETMETDTLSSNQNEALQTFIQNLYGALKPANNLPPPSAMATDDNGYDATSTLMSGGTNFRYTVDLNEADLGDYLPSVKANLKTALDNIGKYISSSAVFDLKIFTINTDPNTLAETTPTMINAKSNGRESIDTSFVSDSIYGVELHPNSPDAMLYINLGNMNDMSFSGLPTPEKFDLTSILTHEILHGLAFAGALNSPSPLRTGFDELISTENSMPIFEGRHAATVNSGSPIPLAPSDAGMGSAYYHVDAPDDLMAAGIKKGEVKSISALDIAMLQDIGVSVTGVLPPVAGLPKIHNAYHDQSANLQNLIGSIKQSDMLKTDFDNLVLSLGSMPSSANLQDFLTQLATNTDNGRSFQNGVGQLLSVSA